MPFQRSWYSFTNPEGMERLSWLWVAGWLHTEISVRHRELNPETVAHLCANRARRLTLTEAIVLTMLRQTTSTNCRTAIIVVLFGLNAALLS